MILSVCCYIVPTATEPLSRMGDSYSGSSDEVARNPIAPQGMGSVGEEGASNIVGGGSGPSGTGPLGSTATPAASTPAATNSGLSGSKRYRPCRGSPLTQADWEIGFEFMKFLKVFYVATISCSGVRYPTSCIVLHHLFNISVNFRRYREHPNFAHACIDMEGKFRKYYEEMPPIFMLAAVMDPRMKLQGVSLVLRTIGTNLGITTLPSSAHVYDLLTTMYAKYDSKFRSNAVCTAAPLTSSTSTNDEFWNFVSSNLGSSTVTSRIELDKYLDLESVDENDRRDFDVLDWWKKNEVKYPVLSIMARDLLTPPVSTVASESAFSAGKRVLDERRSRLAPDILDCLICLKDWEDARLGIQKSSAKDEFRGYFADSDKDSD
ncbi:hypothetical protein RHSIM_Rhsim10G0057500 [Rhododendron simsii]|uniref:HAT C-terminal dimerisation domain-containing protein n=1 Tax=Rhododendron simsii TaxID=118357 RepID=A0A834GHF9_RHOSS|nr:hypothetical protein RHSIM_Rhsim10G0057500 [Rhododendron simsii]